MNFKNSNIEFDNNKHCYSIKGIEYKAVSKVINNYLSKFDSKKWSTKKANEEGITPLEMKEQWSLKGSYSTLVGKEFHFYVHMFLKYNKFINPYTDIQHRIKEFHNFWNCFKDKIEIVETELIIAHKDYEIAGTLDFLGINQTTGVYTIMDWKTNQEIKQDNSYGSKILSPLNHLDDCELNKYSLQATFYKNILKSNFNINIKDGYLIHFPANAKCVIIPVKNMDHEVNTILENPDYIKF